jgi:hypothetical protein
MKIHRSAFLLAVTITVSSSYAFVTKHDVCASSTALKGASSLDTFVLPSIDDEVSYVHDRNKSMVYPYPTSPYDRRDDGLIFI